LAERKIPVQYAKQIKGRKMYGGQSTFIPIKVNSSGVLPLIFAFAITSLPSLIMGLFWPNTVNGFTNFWNTWLGTNGWLYPLILSVLIVFFAYFYAMIQFNPDDVAKNIQQYGGFVPGIRPGKPTGDHLRKISNRITLFGAIYLAFIALVPSVIFRIIGGANGIGLVNAFSTTGLLIVVSAALEFNQQLESQLMMRHYKGFLK
ncbi:MAG: SecY family transport protein, partial [Clostridia bacterium]